MGETLVTNDDPGVPTQTFDFGHEAFGKIGEDGRPENVPEKYWVPGEDGKPGQLKVGDILHQHNHLEKKIGSFEGAPEEGYAKTELALPEGVQYAIEDDDPLVAGFSELAKDLNMSQAAFDKAVNWYVNAQLEQQAANSPDAARAAIMEKIGPTAQAELDAMTQHFKNSLPDSMSAAQKESLFTGYKHMLNSVESFNAMKFLLESSRAAPLPSFGAQQTGGLTLSQVQAEHNRLDANGKRLYDTDISHRKKVTEMYEQLAGKGPADTEVHFKTA